MKPKKLPKRELLLKEFIYDPDTGIVTRRVNSNNQVKKGHKVGSVNAYGYLTVKFQRKMYFLHRFVYYLHFGIDPHPHQVDHIDGDRQNNKASNLRLVNNSWNTRNIKKRDRGVNFNKCSGKWMARIPVHGKRIFLGEFKEKEDAIMARKQAEVKYWGQFMNGADAVC